MDLKRIDLNLLIAFDALMAEGSVSAAADRLAVGQSAMSSTLGRLRKLLNDPVMVREGRTMQATPVAEALVEPIRETLAQIEAMLSNTHRFDPSVDRRSFTVMTSEYAVLTILRPLMTQLTAEVSNIRLHLEPVTKNFPDRLARNQVHFVIAPPEEFTHRRGGVPGEFSFQPLYTDRFMVAVDQDNTAVGQQISLDQFSEMPYLATTYDDVPMIAESQLDALGVVRRAQVTAPLGIAPFLLRDTPLITLLPALVGRRISEDARLRLLEPPMPLPAVTETLIWNSRYDFDPSHCWLRERLRALADDIQSGLL